MKKQLFLKSGCTLLIALFGAVLPLSSAQAEDLLESIHKLRTDERAAKTYMKSHTSSTMPRDSTYQSTPQGAQGPMRSDMMDDAAIERQRNEQQQLERQRMETERDMNRDRGQQTYPQRTP